MSWEDTAETQCLKHSQHKYEDQSSDLQSHIKARQAWELPMELPKWHGRCLHEHDDCQILR